MHVTTNRVRPFDSDISKEREEEWPWTWLRGRVWSGTFERTAISPGSPPPNPSPFFSSGLVSSLLPLSTFPSSFVSNPLSFFLLPSSASRSRFRRGEKPSRNPQPRRASNSGKARLENFAGIMTDGRSRHGVVQKFQHFQIRRTRLFLPVPPRPSVSRYALSQEGIYAGRLVTETRERKSLFLFHPFHISFFFLFLSLLPFLLACTRLFFPFSPSRFQFQFDRL